MTNRSDGTKRTKIFDLFEPSTSKNVTIIETNEDGEDDVFSSSQNLVVVDEGSTENKGRPYKKIIKIIILVGIWIVCGTILMTKNEKVQELHQISIPKGSIQSYSIVETPLQDKIKIILEGALLPAYYANLSTHNLYIWVELVVTRSQIHQKVVLTESDVLQIVNISDIWSVPIVSEKLIGRVPEVKHSNDFQLPSINYSEAYYFLRVKLETNLKTNFPVTLGYDLQPISFDDGIIYAAMILLGLYILIIFDIVHRTLAAMLASTMSVAVLAALNARPTMAEIMSWIDVETLLLLFSMMTLVAILGETGIFDYLAVVAYKLTAGKIWPLITTLCIFTAACSCFLDNVTTALLMTPVTIRLCEVMKLNPAPVLMSMLVFSNIGGALTPIGDPPNVIIASNPDVMKAGVTFSTFTLHMSIGVFFSFIIVYLQLRFIYRNPKHLRYSEPTEVQDLKREIAVWKRVAASMSSYSKDEEVIKDSLYKRTNKLLGKLKTSKANLKEMENYEVNLQDLEAQYPIKDKILLAKSSITLLFVITVFFLHSIPAMSRLGLGWTALLGALLLLLLTGGDDVEAIFTRVEWSTLLFFASLFILMEALSRLGLIDWIGKQTLNVIMSVEQEHRLAVAILLILWVSAFASAFVDNIPLTTMMIRIATALADDMELRLPLQPLVWALSFGACLGGNGTLFGSSSNIICAGVAEQHGYKLSFLDFMKIGFPIMLSSMLVVTIYLMIAHVAFTWH